MSHKWLVINAAISMLLSSQYVYKVAKHTNKEAAIAASGSPFRYYSIIGIA
jgi:hypothetical protein